MTLIAPFESLRPQLAPSVFVAPGAVIVGDVHVGDEASIWFGCVLRGDVHSIRVGARTNIQDRSIVHVTSRSSPTKIGASVTVGHGAIIHGCTIGAGALIGMGAVLLDGSDIGEGSLVGAGSLVPPGKHYPPRSLILGNPARVVRPLRDDELARLAQSAEDYVALAKRHRASFAS